MMVSVTTWWWWWCVVLVMAVAIVVEAQEMYNDLRGPPEPPFDSEALGGEETDPNDEFRNSPTTATVSVAGEVSVLACNITSPRHGDSVQLVLWYRDHVSTPIFSYDVRSGVYYPSKPKEWADPELLGERAHFSVTTHPAALVINHTKREDEGVYRCRVDYKLLTTTHARVNLTVIEPVDSVRIVDEGGLELVGAAGPYTIGQRPSLTCRVTGGDPPPAVTWWRDGRILDSTFHHQTIGSPRMQEAGTGLIINTIHLRALKKEDLRSTFTCKAGNHERAPTKEAAVEIDMNFGPESVMVRGLEGPISAGRPHQVVCEARGSRPPAILTWWLDGHMKKSVSHMTSLDGLVSTSTLELVVTPQDEGSKLTCRAENPELSSATIEDPHKLQVLYPPEVRVAAGASLDLDHIKEGDDVYFDCHVKARPEAHKITWTFNGAELQQNVSAGIMVVGKSLVQQKVSKKQAGDYACSATNTEGSNISAPILLSVKYAPVCRVEQTDVYGVGRHEKTTVTCRVEADPPVTAYRWAFNNTGEFVDIPGSHFDIKGNGIKSQRSDLRYSPVSDLDYGTLLCWATNLVGTQRTPCTFTVFPAGKPDAVSSCRVENETEESVWVRCEPGYSGGMDQSFLMEAWDDDVVRATDTSDTPFLQVMGLRPGTRYTLKIFAVNSMGRSQPYTFTAFTLTDVAERRTALGAGKPGEPLSPLIGCVIGGVLVLVLVLVIAVVVARCKRRKPHEAHSLRESSSAGEVGHKGCTKSETSIPDTTPIADTHTMAGPDLVSTSQESTTPLIGNGRLLQGQDTLPKQQQQQQQRLIVDPAAEATYYHEKLVDGGGVGGGGGALVTTHYPQQHTQQQGQQKMTFMPVYDYQHHHPPAQTQADLDWAAMGGDSVWADVAVRGGSIGGGVGGGVVENPAGTSPPMVSPGGAVDPRRHSAYLRPLERLPPQTSHIPAHATDTFRKRHAQHQYMAAMHGPPSSAMHGPTTTMHGPTTTMHATTATPHFQPGPEHESAV